MLIFTGKLVSVAQHDLPLAALTAVDLGATQCPGPRVISGATSHVLQVYGVSHVVCDDRHDVLRNPIGGFDSLGGPVEPGADLLPASLVTAERAHDHHVIGV